MASCARTRKLQPCRNAKLSDCRLDITIFSPTAETPCIDVKTYEAVGIPDPQLVYSEIRTPRVGAAQEHLPSFRRIDRRPASYYMSTYRLEPQALSLPCCQTSFIELTINLPK